MPLRFKDGALTGLRERFGWRTVLFILSAAAGFGFWYVKNMPKPEVPLKVAPPAVATSAPALVAQIPTAPASASLPAKAEKPKKVADKKLPKPALQASAAHAAPPASAPIVATASAAPRVEERFTQVKRYEQIFGAGKVKGWEHPNAAPCRKHMGCTLEWGLSESGWPLEVRAQMAHVVRTESPKRMQIHKGDRFDFMASANSRGPWMDRNVVAAWSDSARVELASYWDYETGDTMYRYVVPDICGNISGQVFRVVNDKVRLLPGVPQSGPMATVPYVDSILGITPVGGCN